MVKYTCMYKHGTKGLNLPYYDFTNRLQFIISCLPFFHFTTLSSHFMSFPEPTSSDDLITP